MWKKHWQTQFHIFWNLKHFHTLWKVSVKIRKSHSCKDLWRSALTAIILRVLLLRKCWRASVMVDMIHIEQCQDIISHPTICSVLPELRTKPPKELALKRSTGANLARTITANYGSCCGFGWLWEGGACSALCFVMLCSVVFYCVLLWGGACSVVT